MSVSLIKLFASVFYATEIDNVEIILVKYFFRGSFSNIFRALTLACSLPFLSSK